MRTTKKHFKTDFSPNQEEEIKVHVVIFAFKKKETWAGEGHVKSQHFNWYKDFNLRCLQILHEQSTEYTQPQTVVNASPSPVCSSQSSRREKEGKKKWTNLKYEVNEKLKKKTRHNSLTFLSTMRTHASKCEATILSV